jgi:hypothetical protein
MSSAHDSEHQRPPAAGIPGNEHCVAKQDEQAVRPFNAVERFGEPPGRRRCVRAGDPMDEHLGVHRRSENRSLLLEPVSQLGGIRQVAVMRQRDVAAARPRQHGLGVVDRRASGRAVSSMADGDGSAKGSHVLIREPLANQSHGPASLRRAAGVDRYYSGRLLAAMLQ